MTQELTKIPPEVDKRISDAIAKNPDASCIPISDTDGDLLAVACVASPNAVFLSASGQARSRRETLLYPRKSVSHFVDATAEKIMNAVTHCLSALANAEEAEARGNTHFFLQEVEKWILQITELSTNALKSDSVRTNQWQRVVDLANSASEKIREGDYGRGGYWLGEAGRVTYIIVRP